jgi:hypothetical protein
MPNWCECDLYIEGAKEKVEELLRLMKTAESDFDFNRVIPYPERFRDLDGIAEAWDKLHPPPWNVDEWKTRPLDGFNQGGYRWRVQNWGTKWLPCEVQIGQLECWHDGNDVEVARVEINFWTPWSPPTLVIQRAAQLFPELRFDLRYFEGGAMINGRFTCENGEVAAEESGRYFGNRGG